MGRAIELRTDYTSATLRLLAKRGKDTAQTRRLLAIAAVLDGGVTGGGGEGRRHGPPDAAGLGDKVQRTGAGRLGQQALAGCARQAHRRTQRISRPTGRGGSDPSEPWRGALAGVRSDHAVA